MAQSPKIRLWRNKASFSLLELIIVVGILGILGATTLVILNPIELFNQARDANRVSEINDINKAIQLYKTLGGSDMGTANIVYISLPDTSSICANLNLPSLPVGWSYQCKINTNFRNINGTGWLPINFSSLNPGSPFASLPVDPINSSAKNLYYAYINGGVVESWNLIALLQSEKYLKGYAINDGGSDPARFEAGTDLTLWSKASGLIAYWKYDNNALDASGNNINGTLVPPSGGVYSDTGKSNQGYHFVGTGGHINFGSPAIAQLTGPVTIMTWANLDVDPPLVERYIFVKSSATSKGWGLSIQPGPFARFRISSDGTNNITATTGAIPITQWIHIAGVYEPSTALRVYVNGVLSANNTTAIPASQFNNVASNLIAGYEPGCGGCYYYRGISDEVRLYNRAVTASEIQALYEAGK